MHILEKNSNRVFVCIVMAALFFFAGCGSEEERNNIGERLSGPAANSALPMRIDEIPTPTPTMTPQDPISHQADSIDQTQGDLSESEGSLDTPTPTPDVTQTDPPSDSDKDEDVQQEESQVAPTPTPTPTPSPTPVPKEAPSSTRKTAAAMPAQETQTTSDSGKDEKKAPPSPTVKKDAEKKTTLSSQDITLKQVEVCSKISNRQPSGTADTFSFAQVKKIYTWMKVSGVTPPATVKHIYYRNGNIVATVKLKLKYASMRTWSQKTFKAEEAVGKWKVLITTDNEDDVLAVREFTVTP